MLATWSCVIWPTWGFSNWLWRNWTTKNSVMTLFLWHHHNTSLKNVIKITSQHFFHFLPLPPIKISDHANAVVVGAKLNFVFLKIVLIKKSVLHIKLLQLTTKKWLYWNNLPCLYQVQISASAKKLNCLYIHPKKELHIHLIYKFTAENEFIAMIYFIYKTQAKFVAWIKWIQFCTENRTS